MSQMIEKYRALVTAPESLRALEATIGLVESAIGLQIHARGPAIAVSAMARWTPSDGSWKPLSALLDDAERGATGRGTQMPPRRRGQLQDRSRLVRAIWCLGALPRRLSTDSLPDSQYSFLLDALLLLFHQTYFALLPRLERAAGRRDLISSFFAFAESLPDLSERFRVVGLAYQAQGDVPNALTSFERALRASHVDEHVFMTRLQTLWTMLLDNGDFRAALELLLGMMPMIPLKHLPELRELIAVTFEEYGEACSAQGRAAG